MEENNTMTEQQDQKNEFLLEVNNLKQYFPIKAGLLQRVVGNVKAVDGIRLQN